jgi:hypothetical protein
MTDYDHWICEHVTGLCETRLDTGVLHDIVFLAMITNIHKRPIWTYNGGPCRVQKDGTTVVQLRWHPNSPGKRAGIIQNLTKPVVSPRGVLVTPMTYTRKRDGERMIECFTLHPLFNLHILVDTYATLSMHLMEGVGFALEPWETAP